MVLHFCYLAIKLPNCKSVDEKLSRVGTSGVSRSFIIKIVSRKKLLKNFGTPSNSTSGEIFLFQNLRCVFEISQYFFCYFKSFASDLSTWLKILFWPFPSVSN